MIKKIFLLILIIFNIGYSLTLNEAIDRTLKVSPLYRSYERELKSTYFTYKTWISPFFPSLSYSFSYSKYFDINPEDYFYRTQSLKLNWIIYDHGKRFLEKKNLMYGYLASKERFDENILDILFNVKYAYLKCAASLEILKFRKTQLKAAKLNLDIAKKKKKLGLVKKSDVLQAQVRYENAKYQLTQAENQYKKDLAELNSWIGFPLDKDTKIDIEDFYSYSDDKIPDFKSIKKKAFQERPILKKYRYEIKIAKNNVKERLLSFTPYLTVSFSKNKTFSSLYGEKDSYDTFSFSLNWTIFSGFQRYYIYLSSKEKERKSRYELKEIKRKIKLNLYKIYTDLKTAVSKLKLAQTILKEANLNYKQALGEYKVGTGDILSLIKAEESLAKAHETLISSMLDVALAKINLEREIGITDLREVKE